MKKKETGEFGTIYTEFQNKPKEAIKHLKKVKEGECINAFYRKDIGYVDLVWGEIGTAKNNYQDGYGLSHIIHNHQKEIKELGFEIEDFIPLVFVFGKLTESTKEYKIYLTGETFKLVIKTQWNHKDKKFILSAFDLRPISKKNPKRAKQVGKRQK